MVEFRLTEEQKALQTLAREFAQREIVPLSAELDKNTDPSKCHSWEVFDKLAQVGLKTVTIKKKRGGAEVDWLTVGILTEEFCAADGGIGASIMQGCWKLPKVFQELVPDEKVEKFLRPFIENPRYIMGVALTEPEGGGCDNIMPCLDPKAGMQLSVTQSGDHFILNGMKHFISNGGMASLYMVFARTDRKKPITEGMTVFMVPADAPGFSVGRWHDKLGVRGMSNAELIFENCRIPVENQVSPWNGASKALARFLPHSNSTTATVSLGIARALFQRTLEYTKQRVQGAMPIIEHQPTKMMLADMWMLIEVSRNLLWKAMWTAQQFVDTQDPAYWNPPLFKSSKPFISECASRVAHLAMEIHGGYGVMRDVGLEKLVRDALTMLHPDATNTALRIAIGDALSKGH